MRPAAHYSRGCRATGIALTWDECVCRGLVQLTMPEQQDVSGKRSRPSRREMPAMLCLMQLLQSDVGTVSPIARRAILSLLESLLSSVATQHTAEMYRRPLSNTMRGVADASVALVTHTLRAVPDGDVDMATESGPAGAPADDPVLDTGGADVDGGGSSQAAQAQPSASGTVAAEALWVTVLM